MVHQFKIIFFLCEFFLNTFQGAYCCFYLITIIIWSNYATLGYENLDLSIYQYLSIYLSFFCIIINWPQKHFMILKLHKNHLAVSWIIWEMELLFDIDNQLLRSRGRLYDKTSLKYFIWGKIRKLWCIQEKEGITNTCRK